MMRFRTASLALACAVSLGAVGCSSVVSDPMPDLPALPLPAQWQSPVPWENAAPAAHLDKGPWWEAFGDERLNQLSSKVE